LSGALPRLWQPHELAERLQAPDADEAFSCVADPVEGSGCLVLDLENGAGSLGTGALERLRARIPTLPCVTVALGEALDEPLVARLAAGCDVVVPDRSALTALRRGFERTPIAALALVQLLRATPHRSIHDALVAESFAYSTLQSGREFQEWLRRRHGAESAEIREPPFRAPRFVEETGPTCRLERDRDRLEIRLSRPARHNAFSRAMRDDLCEALQLAASDPSLQEVVLCGEGASFCSGGDLDEFGSFPDPAAAHAIRTTRSPARWIAALASRMRAEVHGACIGAGVELPAFTHHVTASEDACFALPEVGLGLVPGAGGTASLPARIGRQRTAWLALSGARIDAATALAWGLVDEVRLGQHETAEAPGSSRGRA